MAPAAAGRLVAPGYAPLWGFKAVGLDSGLYMWLPSWVPYPGTTFLVLFQLLALQVCRIADACKFMAMHVCLGSRRHIHCLQEENLNDLAVLYKEWTVYGRRTLQIVFSKPQIAAWALWALLFTRQLGYDALAGFWFEHPKIQYMQWGVVIALLAAYSMAVIVATDAATHDVDGQKAALRAAVDVGYVERHLLFDALDRGCYAGYCIVSALYVSLPGVSP